MEEKTKFDKANDAHFMFASNMARQGRNGIESLKELTDKFYRPNRMSTQQLKNYLDNPYKNIDKLQDLSQKMIIQNGILKEFINYKSYILTNDHYIYPSDAFKYSDKDSIQKDELKVAEYLERFSPKTLVSWITKRILQNGEVYIYKRETKDGMLMQEIPSKICEIKLLDEFGIFRYGVNMKSITDKEINYFPDEIQKAFKTYQRTKGKGRKDFIGDFYIVGENGVAFQLNQWENKGLPYYLHLFTALINLSDAEDLDNINNELDNYKLLLQTALTDDDGLMLMDAEVVTMYHEALKSTVPEGIGVVTTPLEVSPVTLGDSKLKNYEHVNNIKAGIYDNAGIANELFNGNAKTKEATLLSALVDTLVPLEIQALVSKYLNYELKRKFKRGKWRVSFVHSTYFNKDQAIKTERENLTVYGSKKKYLATQGFTPIEAINIIYAESLLELADTMEPMQTAHTISGKIKAEAEKENAEENEENPEDKKEDSLPKEPEEEPEDTLDGN